MDSNLPAEVQHTTYPWHITQTLLITIVTIFTIIGNISNLIILPRIPLYGSAVTQFYLTSLAMADLGVGLLVTPFSIQTSIEHVWTYGETWCEVTAISVAVLCATSIYSITALCVDRYLHLTYPLHYETIVTRRRCFLIILSIWLLSVTVFIGHKLSFGKYYYDDMSYICTIDFPSQWKFTIFIICIVVVPSAGAIVFTNYKVVVMALRHVKQINAQVNNEGNDLECTTNLAMTLTLHANKWKAIKVNFVICATFFMAWVPYSILQVVLAMATIVPQPIVFTIQWVALGNSFWNSFIYFFMNSQYRQRAKELLMKITLWNKVTPASENTSRSVAVIES